MQPYNPTIEADIRMRAEALAEYYGVSVNVAQILILEGVRMGIDMMRDLVKHIDRNYTALPTEEPDASKVDLPDWWEKPNQPPKAKSKSAD